MDEEEFVDAINSAFVSITLSSYWCDEEKGVTMRLPLSKCRFCEGIQEMQNTGSCGLLCWWTGLPRYAGHLVHLPMQHSTLSRAFRVTGSGDRLLRAPAFRKHSQVRENDTPSTVIGVCVGCCSNREECRGVPMK